MLKSNNKGIINVVINWCIHNQTSMTKCSSKQKAQDRQGGKFACKWLGPHTVANITKTGLCTLMIEKGEALRKKYNVSLLKQIFRL